MERDLLIRGKNIWTTQGFKPQSLFISKGMIQEVKPFECHPPSFKGEIQDAGELWILPGLIDCHVHINEPGRTEWEGFSSATQAALAGGTTTLIDMPLNCSPVTVSELALKEKQKVTPGKLFTDCGFFGGIIPGNSEEIFPLFDLGVFGFKCFLIHSGLDEFPHVTDSDLEKVMPLLAQTGLPLLVHAELDLPEKVSSTTLNRRSYQGFLNSRPPEWEIEAIEKMIFYCRKFRTRVHIVHLSAAGAIPSIKRAKEEGLPFTVETCPHYLSLEAEKILDGATHFKCCPPIREKQNREDLWAGLSDGTIDFIVSDHSPSTPELKLFDSGDIQSAWGGIGGLQFTLPLIWSEMKKRKIDPTQLGHWLSRNQAFFLGINEKSGGLEAGKKGDFVLFDPNKIQTLEHSKTYHRHKIHPYLGEQVYGEVVSTTKSGIEVYNSKKGFYKPTGKVLKSNTHRP